MTVQSVLVCDDEPDIRTIAELSLASVGGYDVTLAASGSEALALAQANRPDVILLDVMMPAMDGPQTLAALRKLPSLKDVPVIFLTAKVQEREVEQYLSYGAVGVIPKPFDPMKLAEQIAAIVASTV